MSTKLTRIHKDHLIGGVCTGLAEYYDIDVTLIRLIFIVGSLFWGMFLFIYLILLLITPSDK